MSPPIHNPEEGTVFASPTTTSQVFARLGTLDSSIFALQRTKEEDRVLGDQRHNQNVARLEALAMANTHTDAAVARVGGDLTRNCTRLADVQTSVNQVRAALMGEDPLTGKTGLVAKVGALWDERNKRNRIVWACVIAAAAAWGERVVTHFVWPDGPRANQGTVPHP